MVRLLGAVAVASVLMLAGCSDSQMAYLLRQGQLPSDEAYSTLPLGRTYDTPQKAQSIKDPVLREAMGRWFQLREQYVKTWREHGPGHPDVNECQKNLVHMKAYIQAYALRV